MLCRKHLQNAQILAVEQIGFERIVRFDFLCSSDFSDSKVSLYAEIMGKYSNIILVENGIILGALKSTSLEENTKRILFSGAKYALPSPQGKANPLNLDELENAFLQKSGDTAKFICAKIEGIAYSSALEMVEKYGEGLTAKNLYDYILAKPSPCIVYEKGEMKDFKVRSENSNKKCFDSLLEAQTEYYSFVYQKKTFEAQKRKLEVALLNKIKKVEKKLALMRQKLLECDEADEIKLKGELITANIYLLQKGMKGFEATNYYKEDCPKIKIELDSNLTPAQNAQRYYKRYAKLKRTLENLLIQIADCEDELLYLNSIKSNIYSAELLIDLLETEEELVEIGFIKKADGKKKKQQACPFRSYNYLGFKILAGRNNLQNDRLLKEILGEDIWLHTQKYHSSHLAIITEGRAVPDEVIKVAAEICAYYSDGRDGSKIPVDYTFKRFVKKPPKKARGFVIYTDYKTALAEPNAHEELKI